ncbi:MAG: hypothetical protein KAI44_10290 [Methylococcales bacterium]|nr:hypothetical protein [Methylococcales bacterium]MCK5479297.1 hypothetical protein [Methylococcales bacterium]
MNKIKLLSKLEAFFVLDEAKKRQNASEIKDVLERLNNKQQKTKKMLKQCKNEELKKVLLLEVDVIDAQIEKGEKFLQELSLSR